MVGGGYSGISLASLWYHHKPHAAMDNVITFSCFIAKLLHRRFKIHGLALPSCPIRYNPILTAVRRTLSNRQWQHQGIKTIGKISNGKILAFELMKSQFGLSDSSFL